MRQVEDAFCIRGPIHHVDEACRRADCRRCFRAGSNALQADVTLLQIVAKLIVEAHDPGVLSSWYCRVASATGWVGVRGCGPPELILNADKFDDVTGGTLKRRFHHHAMTLHWRLHFRQWSRSVKRVIPTNAM
jgi:hypothetical protein